MTDTCLLDRREPDYRRARLVAAGFEVTVPETELESGDVILHPQNLAGASVGIEIKTTQELLTLVPSGLSQMKQFQRMLMFEHRVLVVVGTYSTWAQDGEQYVLRDGHDKRRLTYASVQGALFNLQAHLGFLIRGCAAEHLVGQTVRNIHDFFNKDHTLLSKPRPLTLTHGSADGLAVLMTLPGIGQTHAEKILNEYGTLSAAICQVETWDNLHGIGPVMRKKVSDFLQRKW